MHANDNATPHVLVVEELPDGREVAVRAPLPERVTFEAVFCADCSRLCLVKQPGRLCVGCQDKRDEAARWAALAGKRAA
jgi:hypothetical protein